MPRAQDSLLEGQSKAGSREGVAWALGSGFGFVVAMVGFCLAMVTPQYILPAVIVFGVLLSFMRWPAVLGATTLLVMISDEDEVYIPLWMPIFLAVTWAACRGAWAIHRKLRR